MAADSYDITIDQGADWFWTVRWLVGRNQKTAEPKDIEGYTALLAIASEYNAGQYLLSLTTENNGVDVNPADGSFIFHATATQTTGLPAGKYLYEVRATSPGNVVKRLARGVVTVNPKV